MANEAWNSLSESEQDDAVESAILTSDKEVQDEVIPAENQYVRTLELLSQYELTETYFESTFNTVFPTNGPPQKPIRY